MQRDFDLVVTILGTIRDAEAASLSAGEIRTNMQYPENDSAETVAHHLELLTDAGLIKQLANGNWRLTWKGYDALDQGDDDDDDDDLDDAYLNEE